MKRGVLLFFALLLTLVVFAGCDGDTEKPRRLTNYIGGNDGLAISFSKNAPPDKILDDRQEDFDIALLLENKGEYTILNGKVLATLSGIDREVFNLPSLSARTQGEIERRIDDRGVIREGGKNEVAFGMATITQDFANDFTTDIVADVCYDYRTMAVAGVCLKRETLQLKNADACLIDDEKVEFENSGAPIQVTQVETRKSGRNSVRITFVIENKGVGNTYLLNTFSDSCSGHEKDEARVHVSLDAPSPRVNFRCDLFNGASQGNVKLYDKKRQVSCTIDTTGLQETAFEAPINIQIDYTYRNAIFKEITIENANVL